MVRTIQDQYLILPFSKNIFIPHYPRSKMLLILPFSRLTRDRFGLFLQDFYDLDNPSTLLSVTLVLTTSSDNCLRYALYLPLPKACSDL